MRTINAYSLTGILIASVKGHRQDLDFYIIRYMMTNQLTDIRLVIAGKKWNYSLEHDSANQSHTLVKSKV